MNKNKNKSERSLFENQNNNSHIALLDNIFDLKKILNFDFFQRSSIYREKLQIIFANIRV
ncbi:hypothetical protein DB895_09525 [Flavobacterium psychrotolerans]|uniref:Uncharacterized protein n=1 Tax=Flavobacterium psychrotolerans TaxID=2169410 RepID=A0A2U1JIK6_9FLAO|nr:hypothetical protein DB895_09525 [Flavobacterium psychrotolerans]